LIGGQLRGVVPDHQIRYGVLAVCAASALVLLTRSVV
jgi:hypothetical protein